jgi:hypothetical protein
MTAPPDEVRSAIEQAGAELRYLPPYSLTLTSSR